MKDLRFLLRVSRPRFWFYLFGPYLVGLAAGAGSASNRFYPEIALFGLYFLISANLLVYGVNDIFDYETDRLNEKKVEYEALVTPEKRRLVWVSIAVTSLPFFALLPLLNSVAAILLAAFVLLSVFYSAPPVRAKAIPFLDSAFNVLYVMPGLFAYSMITGDFPPVWVVVAAGLWTAAMHAFSAIPDITSDTDAGVSTIATELGRGWTHFFCAACYIVASFICIAAESPIAIFGILYLGIVRFSDAKEDYEGIFSVYRLFPYINAAVGFIIFWYLAYPKLF
jgi:4-hydroxybenzoate polyprenyltransferase